MPPAFWFPPECGILKRVDEMTFWHLIDDARSGNDCDATAQVVQTKVESMSVDDVTDF
jgi:hypothetical protein